MMAKAHVLTGVAAVTTFAALGDFSPTAFALALTSVPGFALLSDIDHAKSMVSSTYGFVTRIFALFLGHRRETHSFPGIAVFGLVTWAATNWVDYLVSQIWLILLLTLGWAALLRAFGIKGWFADLLPISAAVVVVCYRDEWVAAGGAPYPLEFIPLAVVIGMALHVAGDCLTNSGCPLWWPFSKQRTAFSFRLRRKGKKRSIRTNSKFEHKVIVPLLWLTSIGTTLLWVAGLS
jgi:membrane-bound metal-dependent hydrolase YbcI (DUF457 family)